MQPQPKLPRIAPTGRMLLLVLLLLSLGTPRARASTSTPAANYNVYTLQISQSKDPICVGDAVNVSISWYPNLYSADELNGLAQLTPLMGPSRIQVKASLGYFYPETPPPPGSNSGTISVTYIAEKAGQEKIFAVAWNGGSSDAIASTGFEVKSCEYIYTLNAEFNLGVTDEGISYTTRYTVKSTGILVAPDPDDPLHLEARNKVVKLSAVMTSWSSSKCTLFTFEPGSGMGYVDAKAEPGPLGIGMQLKLAPPVDFAWDVDYSFACDGQSQTLAGVYPLSESDPWISAVFPSGSGQQTIKLDMFEIPLNKMKGSPGLSVSYTATITLEKRPPK